MNIADELAAVEPRLVVYAHKLCHLDSDAAYDLVQDTYVKVLTKLDRFTDDGEPNSFARWCSTVMHNVFINKLRRKVVSDKHVIPWPLDIYGEHTDDPPGSEPVSETATGKILFAEVCEALRSMPKISRDVIIEISIRKRSYDDAAEILGVPVGTVRSRLSRARNMIREKFA